MVDIKGLVQYWKPVVFTVGAVIATVVSTTLGVIAWATEFVETQIEEETHLMDAKNALAHDYYFQTSRVNMKKLEMQEHKRELNALYKYIGDDEPTPSQAREIQYLEEQIHNLKQDIENIEKQIADAHK